MEASTSSGTWTKQHVKELARRRLGVFFYVLITVSLISAVMEEVSENPLFIVDDTVTIIVAVLGLVYLVATWKKNSEQELHRANNIGLAMAVIFLIATIFAFIVESTEALGNDFPSLIFTIILFVNRFI